MLQNHKWIIEGRKKKTEITFYEWKSDINLLSQ